MTTQIVIDTFDNLSVWEVTGGVVSSYPLAPDDYRYTTVEGGAAVHILSGGVYVDAPAWWYAVGAPPGETGPVIATTTSLTTPAPLGIAFSGGYALGVQNGIVAVYVPGEGVLGTIEYLDISTGAITRTCTLSLLDSTIESNIFPTQVTGGIVVQFSGGVDNRLVLMRTSDVFAYGSTAGLHTVSDPLYAHSYSYAEGLWQLHTGAATYITTGADVAPTLAPWVGVAGTTMVQTNYSLDTGGNIWRNGAITITNSITPWGATDEYVMYLDEGSGTIHLIDATTGADIDLGTFGNLRAVYQVIVPKFWRVSKPYSET
jgi:hypothetical protein